MNEILYIIAKDSEGNLYTPLSAEKGNQFYCVNCNNVLVLKKSGKIGPRRKRPHFAHKALMPNCQPEIALHFGFKTLATEKLNEYLKTETPFNFIWRCEYCGEQHTGNFIKKLKSVKLEYDLGFCIPDIALLDHNDEIFAAIEIVVTNKPSESVINYYLENNIILIQINLNSDDDIYQVEEKLTEPSFVKFCVNPKCEVCDNFQEKYIMSILQGKCSNCYKAIKVAVMKDGCNKFIFGPEKFNLNEITFARKQGVFIDEYYSKITSEKYQANLCGQCGTFLKRYSKLLNYFSYVNEEALPIIDFRIRYNCSYCTEKKISDEDDWTKNLKW